MAKTVILHIFNQEPFVADIEGIPGPTDNFLAFSNPRTKDGKGVKMFEQNAQTIIFPWNQIFFVEVMQSLEERREILDFFRE